MSFITRLFSASSALALWAGLAAPLQADPAYQYMIGVSFVKPIAADPVANRALAGTHPYINIQTIKSPPGQPTPFPPNPPPVPAEWQPIFVYRWASEKQLELDMPSVPGWISACMYDNERVVQEPMTPQDEQDAPAPFYGKAAAVCHRAGKLFIASAGMRFKNAGPESDTFSTAGAWDVYSMQTQTAEDDLAKFTRMVANLQGRVMAVNPKAKLLAGIGDFAGGRLQPASVAEAAIKALPPGMGIWMNFGPHAGPHCTDPSCPIPGRPDLLVRVIDDLSQGS
jgi:hypothetical protein